MPSDSKDVQIAQLVDRLMRRIHAGLHARAPEFDTERLGPGGSMILLTLADVEPVAMNDLSRRMARDKSQMTRVLKSLEGKGMILREISRDDGRVCLVRLSDRGRKMVGVLQDVLAETVGQVLTPMSEDERDTFIGLLSRVER